MISVLKDYYKKNCGIKNTLFSNNRFIYFMFTKVAPFLLFVLVIPVILLDTRWFIVGGFFLYLIITGYFFNKRAKKELLKQYGFKSEEYMWNSSKASSLLLEKEKQIIKTHLEEEGISLEKLRYYRSKMDDEAAALKPKVISFPTFCGAMFIVFYNVALTWWANYSVTIEQFAQFIVYNLLILGTVALVGYGFAMMEDIILDSYFYAKDYNVMKDCIKIVDEIIADDEVNKIE